MIKAVILVPETDFESHAVTCLDYCVERGYEVAGIVRGNWVAAADMLRTGAADALIVARDDHLDPDRCPRVEVVAHQPPPGGQRRHSADRRRSRIIRRGEAG